MKKELEFLKKNIPTFSSVVVACSGGPDSMCLVSLLLKLKNELNLKIIVAHVNHCLRKESIDEEKLVRDFALSNNIEFEVLTLKEYETQKFSESVGHFKRYKFFNEVMDKYNSSILLTAHHGDDLIETILMRQNRGSNLSGYAGIPMISKFKDKTILRPLLTTTKDDILEYNKKENVKYCIDESNNKDIYTRNRYRKNILPFLKEENSSVHEKYLKFSKELTNYDNFVTNYIKEKNIYVDNALVINKLKEETEFIQKRSIELLIKKIQEEDFLEVSDKVLDSLVKLINKDNKVINLNNGYICCNYYGKMYIEKNEKKEYLEINFDEYAKFHEFEFFSLNETCEFSNDVICLDSKELSLPLKLRSWTVGDKINVKNLNGSKKVGDIFTNSKVPLVKRENYPVLVDANNNILWVPKLKKSQFAKDKFEKYDIIIKCEAR